MAHKEPPKIAEKKGQQGSHSRGPEVSDVGHVPDSRQQEGKANKEALLQSKDAKKLKINEGGRSHDSDEKGNPAGAVHGLPKPSMRETGR